MKPMRIAVSVDGGLAAFPSVPAGLLEAPGALLETAPQPEALALGAQNPRVAVREHALGVLDRRRRRVAQPPDVVQHGR